MFAPMSRSHDFISHTLYTHFTQIASRFLVQTLYCLKDICPSGKIIKESGKLQKVALFFKVMHSQNISNAELI